MINAIDLLIKRFLNGSYSDGPRIRWRRNGKRLTKDQLVPLVQLGYVTSGAMQATLTKAPVTHEWTPGEIFVFGSNLRGIHGAGAAKFAVDKCQAQMGVGEGLTGESYALPTCAFPGIPMDLPDVAAASARFVAFAKTHPEYHFFLTRVGCGIAGFTDAQIKPMFADAPDNVSQPPEWQ